MDGWGIFGNLRASRNKFIDMNLLQILSAWCECSRYHVSQRDVMNPKLGLMWITISVTVCTLKWIYSTPWIRCVVLGMPGIDVNLWNYNKVTPNEAMDWSARPKLCRVLSKLKETILVVNISQKSHPIHCPTELRCILTRLPKVHAGSLMVFTTITQEQMQKRYRERVKQQHTPHLWKAKMQKEKERSRWSVVMASKQPEHLKVRYC